VVGMDCMLESWLVVNMIDCCRWCWRVGEVDVSCWCALVIELVGEVEEGLMRLRVERVEQIVRLRLWCIYRHGGVDEIGAGKERLEFIVVQASDGCVDGER